LNYHKVDIFDGLTMRGLLHYYIHVYSIAFTK